MSTTSPSDRGTRDRLIDASAELFGRNGYAATGLKAILAASDAPYGSLYHFFPGGKEQLGAEAIRASGVVFRQLVESFFPEGVDVVAATEAFAIGAAAVLEGTDYADACPIATVTLETASGSEAMREASQEAFESWLAVLELRFVESGIDTIRARQLAVELFCAIEGAFLLCRASRSTEALRVVGASSAAAVRAAQHTAAEEKG